MQPWLPDIISSETAVLHEGRITLPAMAGFRCLGEEYCHRVFCRGGHFFDAPRSALLTYPEPRRLDQVLPGVTILSPAPAQPPTKQTPTRYSYEWVDNHAQAHRESGIFVPSRDKLELAGWLAKPSLLEDTRQSIRFTSTDPWSLSHVERLVKKCFPHTDVKWYAKHVGYDLILSGGIHCKLRHYLRRLGLHRGFPTLFGKLSADNRHRFLQGVWGADGWLNVRKNGIDVDMGLSRTENFGYTSMLRLAHALIGMHSSVRKTATKACPNKHRLVFSGYRSYTVFRDAIGVLRTNDLLPPPPATEYEQKLSQEALGARHLLTPVLRVERHAEPMTIYEVP